VILLGGGSKLRQRNDIAAADASWQEYKQRKKENPNAPHSWLQRNHPCAR
jgi:hypothetical protein